MVEDLIRAAQERMAARRVDPHRVRAALPARISRRARTRRYGGLGAIAAAGVAAAAVAVPALALNGGGASIAGSAGSSSAASPAAPVTSGVPASRPASTSAPAQLLFLQPALQYRPTWLPPGLTERLRMASVGDGTPGKFDGVLRTWTNHAIGTDGDAKGGRLELQVSASQDPADPGKDSGEATIDVNGITGYYDPPVAGDDKSYVEWRATPSVVVSVNQIGLGLSKADLLRVARSVRPDSTALRGPLALGWLPPDISLNYAFVGGDSPTSWGAELAGDGVLPATPSRNPARQKMTQSNRNVQVYLGPTTALPPGVSSSGGQRLTVAGHPARLVTRTDVPGMDIVSLVVDLGQGRTLTVMGLGSAQQPFTSAELEKIASHASVTPVDLSWIGTH
jgi:hypothetical protein